MMAALKVLHQVGTRSLMIVHVPETYELPAAILTSDFTAYDNIMTYNVGNSPSHDGRITIAIACTIAVFTIASLVLFIAGFLCRHFAYVCGMSKTRAIV